jgi:hypothetical protein
MSTLIKKFKNGNITIKSNYLYSKDRDGERKQKSHKNEIECKIDIDTFYNQYLTMRDLYLNQINWYPYFVDHSTGLVYDLTCYLDPCSNYLEQLDNFFKDNKKLKLYPLSKKESKSLLQDLENGY